MPTFNQEISTTVGLNTQTIVSNTTTVGNIIDKQGNEAVNIAVHSVFITDGDYTLLLEHGDESNLSDAATVASTDLDALVSTVDLSSSDDNVSKDIGYVGKKRFIRPNYVSTNVSAGGTMGVLVVFGRPRSA